MRYFLEVSYKGTRYSGFQKQKNANTIQDEVESTLEIFYKKKFELTGSSRTDAGVHALQNFFHFDTDEKINIDSLYNLNAILPEDISVKNLYLVKDDAHCRFDAISREYKYYIYRSKSPFLSDRAYYYPYTLDYNKLRDAAAIISEHMDFSSFSKKNTQVKNFNCKIISSSWFEEDDCLIYNVKANRFLRGMVRGLTATMLMIGRGKISISDFEKILNSRDQGLSNFAAPAKGLFLVKVCYPEIFF